MSHEQNGFPLNYILHFIINGHILFSLETGFLPGEQQYFGSSVAAVSK